MSALPRWDDRRGWVGGDTRTLYALTDRTTGVTVVRPGEGISGMGSNWSNVTVRVATRHEAELLWQQPLHVGWTVDD